MGGDRTTWTYEDERQFIDGIGTWTERRDTDVLPMLRQYLENMDLRLPEPWTDAIRKYVKTRIRQLESYDKG